jgi:hypothetical protein
MENEMQTRTSFPGQSSTTARLEQAIREQQEIGRVQIAAYYRAEKRGFASGHALEDWLAAEQELQGRSPD